MLKLSLLTKKQESLSHYKNIMNFNEDVSEKVIFYPQCKYMIYFLLKEMEVVYVGQSSRGMVRCYEHHDIDFDSLTFIKCEKEQLNYLEDFYIAKYLPKYNKRFNGTLYKSCPDNKQYENIVVFNNIRYYKVCKKYKSLIFDSTEYLLKKNNKDFKSLTRITGIEENQLLDNFNTRKVRIKDLEKILESLNAELRIIDKNTKKTIL